VSTEGISECFDKCACAKGRRARPEPSRGVSQVLLDLLDRQGLPGTTVLELGCGLGGLTLAAVSRGEKRADGMDLSPVAIGEASRLAAKAGRADRVAFAVGDGARVHLAPHDVVVLDRVMCCYLEVGALLQNSRGSGAEERLQLGERPLDHGCCLFSSSLSASSRSKSSDAFPWICRARRCFASSPSRRSILRLPGPARPGRRFGAGGTSEPARERPPPRGPGATPPGGRSTGLPAGAGHPWLLGR
jgi:SAM-dependent methyltransferase